MPRLVPDTPPQRVLVGTNFVYTTGYGLYCADPHLSH